MSHQRSYTIYTDGACLGNGGPFPRAGWGAVLRNPEGDVLELAGPVPEDQPQTNGRAELLAIVEALKAIRNPAIIAVFTDSEYIANALNKWLDGWVERGWRKADKKPVAHTDLWEELVRLRSVHQLTVAWVKAPNGIEDNERADRLANTGCYKKKVRSRIPATAE